MKKVLSLCSLLLLSTAASAQQSTSWDDYYLGMQVSQFNIDSGPDFSTAKPVGLTLTVGEQVHPNFAVEARLGFGVADDTIRYQPNDTTTAETDIELDYAVSILAKPQARVSDSVSVYALAGWSRSELSTAGGSGADSGLSYGAGFALQPAPKLDVYLDWLRLMDEEGVALSSINLGFTYRF